MNCCHEHFEYFGGPGRDLDYDQRKAIHDTCADCMEAERVQREYVQQKCTIDPTQPYGEHILLTCAEHPELRWSTKNIDFIGARSIFFAGEKMVDGRLDRDAVECSCSANLLVVVR